MTAKEMRENRAALAAKIKELAEKANADKREFTAEEKPQWDKLNADYDAMTRQIEIAERAAQIESEQTSRSDSPAPGREDYDGRAAAEANADDDKFDARGAIETRTKDATLVLQGWMRVQNDMEPRQCHIDAAKRCGLRLSRRFLDLRLGNQGFVERRDLTVTTTAGGYLIPQGFVPRLEKALLAFGSVRNVAEVLRTDTGAKLPWPTANDTSNKGELLGINTTVGDSVDPTFGEFSLDAYKFSSKPIKVPPELLEDSAFLLDSVLFDIIGERIARIQEDYYTTGDGNGQPNGIVTASILGKTAASATAIISDELIDLEHSIDPAYRRGSAWMMHDNIVKALRKLKGGDGQYIWQAGMIAGAPDTLLNYPVQINQGMAATIEASAKTILFGQLAAYKVREVNAIRLRRLTETYAATDQEGFVGFMRTDGDLLNAGGNPVKHLVQKA